MIGNVALAMTGDRVIGDLYPHIVMEEVHEDRLQITVHPIETGTPVTDHAFPMPYTVEIRCGWSNSTAATEGFVQAVYQQLLQLQASRVPFSIRTGKRPYTSMLMASLGVKTDSDSEFSLMVIIFAQQIVITNTQTTSASSSPMTGGSSQIGSAPVGTGGVGKPGELGTPIDGGASPAPAGSVTPDSTGAITWPNDPALTGTLLLTPSTSAPSWTDVNNSVGALP